MLPYVRDSLQTDAATLAELLGNGKRYEVPEFQRSYSWTRDEWEDLWRDVTSEAADAADHYMGAIVLQRSESDEDLYSVIDGQQRLATLTVVIAALLEELESWPSVEDAEANRQRLEIIRERLLAPRDAASLSRSSRLQLSRADDDFFQSAIINGVKPASTGRLKDGSKALWEAYQYFREQASARFGSTQSGEEIARFIESSIARRLVFIRISVDDEAAAYTVFETLNARGVALGTADLLKNLVLAKAASGGPADLKEMTRRWDGIVDYVSMDDIAGLVHHHANTSARDVGKRQVFKHVRDRIPTKAAAFDYITDLSRAADWYAALIDPQDDLWGEFPGARKWVRVVRLLRAEQYRPLALAACPLFKDEPEKLTQLFKLIATVTFRATSVLKLNSGEIYRAWNRAAIRVASGELNSVAGISDATRAIHGEDDQFRAAFENLDIPAAGPRKKLLRYILSELESDAVGRAIDWEADAFTIEHIMPASPATNWEVDEGERETYSTRVGNYIPLEANLNRDADQRSFDEKVAIYRRSSYSLPQKVEAHEWGPEAIRQHSAEMSKRAAHIWRIDFA
jgi:hypothetical protein